MNLKYLVNYRLFNDSLFNIKIDKRYIINTINAHSFCIAKKDIRFENALNNSDILLPDGSSMTLASKVLIDKKISKIAGFDIHKHLLKLANIEKGKVFYLGSTDKTLKLIEIRIKKEYPHIIVESFSPPFNDNFSNVQTNLMIESINYFKPDILFVGMTAPKQEKWVDMNRNEIDANIISSIGAVFDFYAGNSKRAPQWIINIGFEWLYRFVNEPKRLWKRYLLNNSKFIYYLIKEKYF